MEKGLIHLYCGDGKGKTTAAVGQAIRCAGGGGKVLFFQFMKDNSSSERNIMDIIDNITLINGPKKIKFAFNMTSAEKKSAIAYYRNKFKELILAANDYDMLIMDEITSALMYKFVDLNELIAYLKNKPIGLEVIMTGRDPDNELVKTADYVSEIKKIKHPFDKGIEARYMIEF